MFNFLNLSNQRKFINGENFLIYSIKTYKVPTALYSLLTMAKLAGSLVVVKDTGKVQNWWVAKVANCFRSHSTYSCKTSVHNNSSSPLSLRKIDGMTYMYMHFLTHGLYKNLLQLQTWLFISSSLIMYIHVLQVTIWAAHTKIRTIRTISDFDPCQFRTLPGLFMHTGISANFVTVSRP